MVSPALGDSWGHACTNRVMLYGQEGQWQAQLFKSPSRREQLVRFQVTKDGLRDLDEPNDQGKRKRVQVTAFDKQKKV